MLHGRWRWRNAGWLASLLRFGLGVGAVGALVAALLPGDAVLIGLPILPVLLVGGAVLIIPAPFAALPATTLAPLFPSRPAFHALGIARCRAGGWAGGRVSCRVSRGVSRGAGGGRAESRIGLLGSGRQSKTGPEAGDQCQMDDFHMLLIEVPATVGTGFAVGMDARPAEKFYFRRHGAITDALPNQAKAFGGV
jgi:hypothetical protein